MLAATSHYRKRTRACERACERVHTGENRAHARAGGYRRLVDKHLQPAALLIAPENVHRQRVEEFMADDDAWTVWHLHRIDYASTVQLARRGMLVWTKTTRGASSDTTHSSHAK
jgi:hypothetical protein